MAVGRAADDLLLAGLATGDPDASAAFVRRFQARVFGVAMAVMGDRARAEDVAQEAFLRAWRHAAAYDARRGTVATWLLSITRNVGIDALRADRARPADSIEELFVCLSSADASPEEAALRHDDIARLTAALSRLPTAQRRAVVLAGMGGRTAREIADLDGVPLGTAKTRIRDGLSRLRHTMNDEVSS